MNTQNLKAKIKNNRTKIAVVTTAVVAVGATVYFTKKTDLPSEMIVADASTGVPKFLVTQSYGTFDLTPHVEV